MLDDKQGGKIATSTDNAVDLLSQFSGKIKKISEFVQGIVSEKEWFEILSRKVDKYHIIILDDLERISEKADLKEILGVVEELKKCGCIKVVLVANKEAMEEENQELLNKYCEKVIERVYHITEAPKEINYAEELSGIGVAYAAGIAMGIYTMDLFKLMKRKTYSKEMDENLREKKYTGWSKAVRNLV